MPRQGDPTKQPPECESRFIPYGPDNPPPANAWPGAQGRWTTCPNRKEDNGGFDGERYRCEVCGKSYFLDYEEMR
ncbi:MAG: hypothetical protein PGN33_14150 [Methylobacterium radiotolerans]